MSRYMLRPHMPLLHDTEGTAVPATLPRIIDGHVHIFPDPIISAVWHWFEKNGWPIRYRLTSQETIEFLFARGILHIVALQYAHKPGIAEMLNSYMVSMCSQYPGKVTGMATVYPGEDNAENILQSAFNAGLAGLKLHAHVQCFDMNSNEMEKLYRCCIQNNRPLVMHVGREPNSDQYDCDVYKLCSSRKLECVLQRFPDLKVCVPHLGLDEFDQYRRLQHRYDNLWLDTTMVLSDYLLPESAIDLSTYRNDRIFYGSDFPNIPYAWDREIKALNSTDLAAEYLERITWKNCVDFFTIPDRSSLTFCE